MPFSITLTTTLQLDDDEPAIVAKRKVTNLEQTHDRGCGILRSATKTLWDADAEGAIPSFALMVLTADGEVEVELTTQDGDPSEEMALFTVTKDTPLILGSDDSRFSHGPSDAFQGIPGKINRIRVREINGDDVKPRLRLYL